MYTIESRILDEFNTVRAWVALHQIASLAIMFAAGFGVGAIFF